MRQAGILAGAALHALEHHRPRLAEDVGRARRFAQGLAELDGIEVDVDGVQSNIVRYVVTLGTASELTERCHAEGVFMIPAGANGVRAVIHRDVDDDDVTKALEVIASVLPQAAAAS